MKIRIGWFIGLLAILIAIGCSRTEEKPAPQQNTAPPQQTSPAPPSTPIVPEPVTPASAKGSAAGIEWTIPAAWQAQSSRPMRVATYTIPKATGAPEDGECAVFFFGSGQGGDVRSNIDRWISQFENATPKESKRTVNGIQVTLVEISGTYLSPGGPMMQSQGTKPDYRLLGAIVEAPQGAVFFKATGPSATITAAESNFTALVDSIKTQSI